MVNKGHSFLVSTKSFLSCSAWVSTSYILLSDFNWLTHKSEWILTESNTVVGKVRRALLLTNLLRNRMNPQSSMSLASSDAGQIEIIMRNATLDVCSRSTSSWSARSFFVRFRLALVACRRLHKELGLVLSRVRTSGEKVKIFQVKMKKKTIIY